MPSFFNSHSTTFFQILRSMALTRREKKFIQKTWSEYCGNTRKKENQAKRTIRYFGYG